jgi:hypothetical protein
MRKPISDSQADKMQVWEGDISSRSPTLASGSGTEGDPRVQATDLSPGFSLPVTSCVTLNRSLLPCLPVGSCEIMRVRPL